MFGRPFRILLLAFQAVWLGAIVPGHTRGVVTLPGSEPAGGGCCASADERSCHAGGSKGPSKGSKGDEGDPGWLHFGVGCAVLPRSSDSGWRSR